MPVTRINNKICTMSGIVMCCGEKQIREKARMALGDVVVVWNRVVREGLMQKLTCEKRPERGERASHARN